MAEKKTTNKDMLIKLTTDVGWLKTQFSNHLNHHWQITVILLGAIIAQAVAFVIAAVKLIP